MTDLIFATGNEAKLNQINFVREHYNFPVQIINGKQSYGADVAYAETAATAEEIAVEGALAVARKIGKPVLTEDSTFAVDALNGFPDVKAGLFLKNFGRAEILRIMQFHGDRSATITSACCYAQPDGFYKSFVNTLRGTITPQEKFASFPDWISPQEDPMGGGYNAIFIPEGYDKTLAEISPEEATPWSYREKNFFDVLTYLMANDN